MKERRALSAFLRNPSALCGLALLGLVVLAAVLAPLLYPGDPQMMVAPPLLWPGQNPAYPLGTDSMGRDLTPELLYGAQLSLIVGFAAAALSLVLGVGIGALAGYFGGWVDNLILRLLALFPTMPGFLLLIVIVSIAQQPSVAVVAFSIALVSWDSIARLTRAEFRSVGAKDFVMAARGSGYGDFHIAFREILPNVLPSLIVAASLAVASAILMESALSFMQLGDPNVVSWGMLIGDGREFIRTAWYLSAIPGIAIVITVLALNLLGDGLNDALNPRQV
jgi:peptide/nickel transport system permease protein